MQKTLFIFVQATCLTRLVWSLVRIILLVNKQSIPVGCIPSTLVATTRCQYWGYLVYLPQGIYLTPPPPESPPGKDLEPEITTPPRGQTNTCEDITFSQLRFPTGLSRDLSIGLFVQILFEYVIPTSNKIQVKRRQRNADSIRK